MTTYNDPGAATPVRRTSPAIVAAAWLVVALPAGWGVYQTAKKAMALFTPAAATSGQTTSTSAPVR